MMDDLMDSDDESHDYYLEKVKAEAAEDDDDDDDDDEESGLYLLFVFAFLYCVCFSFFFLVSFSLLFSPVCLFQYIVQKHIYPTVFLSKFLAT